MAEDYLLARAAEPPSALTLGASGRDGGESTSPPSGSSVGQETPRSLSLDLAGGGAPEAADDAGPSDPSFVTEGALLLKPTCPLSGPDGSLADSLLLAPVPAGERKWTEMRRGWLAASTSCVAAGGVKKQKGHRRASSTCEAPRPYLPPHLADQAVMLLSHASRACFTDARRAPAGPSRFEPSQLLSTKPFAKPVPLSVCLTLTDACASCDTAGCKA